MNDIRRVLSYNDVLLCPRNSELDHISDADISIAYDKGWEDYSVPFISIPLINAPMDTVCSPELLNVVCNNLEMPVTIHRWFNSVEEQISFFEKCKITSSNKVFISVGMKDKWEKWIQSLLDYRLENKLDFGILIDVANGDTKSTVNTINFIRESCSNINIMAGNVATRSGFARLQDAGANFIRVGIGGGSICSTRLKTGFGIPTLTSIFDCAKVKDSAYLVADGGIEDSGDICKAIAAGADMCMAGKIFASTSLSSGEKVDKAGNFTNNKFQFAYVKYRGMASKESIQKLNSKKSVISIEGVSGFIPYTGETEEVLNNVIGNLKTSVAYYAGCKNWNEFQKKVKFVEITSQGWEESKTRVNI